MPEIYKGIHVLLQVCLETTMSITSADPRQRTEECKPEDRKETRNHTKSHNFTRSPSIEKIIKFNTFICSQNFFLLPAILTWLRTSQNILKTYSEKCTQFTKALAYLILQTIEEHLRIISSSLKNMSFSDPKRSLQAFKELFDELSGSFTNLPEEMKRKLLEIGVYGSFLLIFLQFGACVLFLAAGAMPGGLIFLLVSITWISYMNYQCLRLILIKDRLKEEERCDNSATQKYIRPKDILGKRTISKLNLF